MTTMPRPAPGTLLLLHGAPNPHGAEGAQLFLFVGDPTAAPIRRVVFLEGDDASPGALPEAEISPAVGRVGQVSNLPNMLGQVPMRPGALPEAEISPARQTGGPRRAGPPGQETRRERWSPLGGSPGVGSNRRLGQVIFEGAGPPPPDLDGQPFRLCVLHFNDLHGHISRLTSHGDRPIFSRMVGYLRQLRRRARDNPRLAVLFLSGGDDLGGALFDELLGDDPASYTVHAGYRLYSAAGVDAGVLGNHDFDRGTPLLARAIAQDARFPLLSANLRAGPSLAERVYPAALLVVKGVRVGLIGLTTAAEIKRRRAADFSLAHPVTTLQNLLPALRPLCDLLIVLSHLGYSLTAGGAVTRDAGDVELASSLPRGAVQLIIGAHTHHALNEGGLSVANVVNNIPIVQAGTLGRFLGEVDITLGPRTAVSHARLIPTADLPPDAAFEQEQVQPLVAQVRPLLARPLGRVAEHPDLTTEAVRNDFAAGESALANFITDALAARCRLAGYPVDLAAIDAPAMRCGLPVGGLLTFGDWFDLMPFADTVRLYRLTGRQLAALLDDNARRADRPDEPHVERGFLQFSRQVRYTLHLGPDRAGACAVQVTVEGLPLAEQGDRLFLLASTSFVRERAAAWERRARREGLPLLEGLGVAPEETDLFVRDLLVAHIREHGGVTEEGGARRDGRLVIERG